MEPLSWTLVGQIMLIMVVVTICVNTIIAEVKRGKK